MRHHLLSSITMAPSSSSPLSLSKPIPNHHHHHKKACHPSALYSLSSSSSSSSSLLCKHSPASLIDLLILLLVLFSGSFLLTSYFSYISHSLSLLLPTPLSLSSLLTLTFTLLSDSPFVYLTAFLLLFLLATAFLEICCNPKPRKCGNPRCKGMKKASEFDLRMQNEGCLRSGGEAVREVDEMPWKGGSEGNPDYDWLRAELRLMAPPNGRAVLVFQARCGCPVAKVEGWGPKRGRRHKKGLALHGRGDHR